jgi:glycosyltransferase involved in cell wall biosynthesis
MGGPTTTETLTIPERTGVVIIGRSEGDRLRRALDPLGQSPGRCVYVDSGSTDGSVAYAKGRGVAVVELTSDRPFTAARGRNAGFDYLLGRWPEVEHVQFLDGDCGLSASWLAAGHATLEADHQLAVATGRLRELRPAASVYNRLCDIEWDRPIGDIKTCGGIAMIRASAYREVGGMNPDLIAGEEADLHIRMRQRGWKLRRIAETMAYHDADLTAFGQWWKRNLRAGHGCAEAVRMYGSTEERYKVRESRSNWLWGLLLPGAALGFAPVTAGMSLFVALGGYAALYGKILRAEIKRGRPLTDSELVARYTVLGKLPQVIGQIAFHVSRLRGRQVGLYEHKRQRHQ